MIHSSLYLLTSIRISNGKFGSMVACALVVWTCRNFSNASLALEISSRKKTSLSAYRELVTMSNNCRVSALNSYGSSTLSSIEAAVAVVVVSDAVVVEEEGEAVVGSVLLSLEVEDVASEDR